MMEFMFMSLNFHSIFLFLILLFFVVFAVIDLLKLRRIESIINKHEKKINGMNEIISEKIQIVNNFKNDVMNELKTIQKEKENNEVVLNKVADINLTDNESIPDVKSGYQETIDHKMTVDAFKINYEGFFKRVIVEIERHFGNTKFAGLKEISNGNYLLVNDQSNFFLFPYFGFLLTAQESTAQLCFDCTPGLFKETRDLQNLEILPAVVENKAGKWFIKKKGQLRLNS